MAARRSVVLVAVVAAGTMAAGCGASGGSRARLPAGPAPGSAGSGGAPGGPGTQAIPTPTPTGLPADPAAMRVIRAWSDALRRGDVRGAASYFALPSQFVNGAVANGQLAVISIRTQREAEAVNATLPCGARFVSADQRGRYVNALFRLTGRPGPGGGCGSGTGQLARTNFVITRAHIVQWIRAPSDPGDNPGGPSRPGPPPPSTPQGPGSTI